LGLEYNFVTRTFDVRKDTANWIALADYDMETAGHMLATERYLYVVFLCHLALETTWTLLVKSTQRAFQLVIQMTYSVR